ncbi:MAG: histone H1 [Phycisphaerales bacterium]|jgi:hypothetical protein
MLNDLYQQLVKLSQEVEPDLQKAAGGNKAAGTRVRKTMQEIRSVAQEIRVKVLEARDTPPA